MVSWRCPLIAANLCFWNNRETYSHFGIQWSKRLALLAQASVVDIYQVDEPLPLSPVPHPAEPPAFRGDLTGTDRSCTQPNAPVAGETLWMDQLLKLD